MSEGSGTLMTASLLQRLQRQDAEGWQRAVRLYYPTVRGWCERAGLQEQDAADVAQEVFRTLAGAIGNFRRAADTSFRGWLYGITRRQLANYWRRQKKHRVGQGGSDAQKWFAELADAGDDESVVERRDGRLAVLRRALDLLRPEVEERTWQAFWRVVVEGQAPTDVAADLGLTANAVYLLKARLLRRLRAEFEELLE